MLVLLVFMGGVLSENNMAFPLVLLPYLLGKTHRLSTTASLRHHKSNAQAQSLNSRQCCAVSALLALPSNMSLWFPAQAELLDLI